MMQTTDQLLDQARRCAEQSVAGDWDDAERCALQAIAYAVIALAQEQQLANDMEAWQTGLNGKPELRDYR